MACQGTISELIGVTTTGVESHLLEVCCALTGTVGSEVLESSVTPDPSPQAYGGD